MGNTIETSYGKVHGVVENGLHLFRGIPYAQPPVGTRRFQPPQKPEPWAGVRDASRFGSAAPQGASMLGPMLGLDISDTNEDCLSLNIWTPGTDHTRRPVLVWIHGGAFMIGAGSQTLYDGAVLARRGEVVVVTINYRLGALGFLHLNELCGDGLGATGNEGILDQIAALEWVRDEISAFGGDPHNVTIFGESAGSISVATLLGTPRAQGLFQRAILQSGSANFVASPVQATRVAEAFLRELNLTPAQAGQLRDMPLDRLLDVQQRLFLSLGGQVSGLPFQPVVDGQVLPRHPFDAIADGLAKDVSVLTGTNLDEMKLFGLMDQHAKTMDDAALVERCKRRIPQADAGTLVNTYREARAARGEAIVPPELWFAIDSDRSFRYPAMRLAQIHRAHQARTYAYLFTWQSPFLGGVLGACHALELPFVFGTLDQPMLASFAGSGAAADLLAARMQDAWIGFAHSGVPGHDALGEWPAYDEAHRATMLLGAEVGVEHAPREPERRVWESAR